MARPIEEYKAKGNYSVDFIANKLTGGVYIYELKINGFVARRKMILMR